MYWCLNYVYRRMHCVKYSPDKIKIMLYFGFVVARALQMDIFSFENLNEVFLKSGTA